MPADGLESLRTSRAWINYNPGPPFDFLAGTHPATAEQLRAELTRLHDAGFRGLVTNTMAFGVEQAPQIAKDCGFEHVVAKLWWQDDELLATEQANLDTAVGAVDAVCLGNEIIQKGIADHDRLMREVGRARERFGRPVTTGFQPPDWQLFPDLATAVGSLRVVPRRRFTDVPHGLSTRRLRGVVGRKLASQTGRHLAQFRSGSLSRWCPATTRDAVSIKRTVHAMRPRRQIRQIRKPSRASQMSCRPMGWPALRRAPAVRV